MTGLSKEMWLTEMIGFTCVSALGYSEGFDISSHN